MQPENSAGETGRTGSEAAATEREGLGQALLTFGQIVSVLLCIAIPVCACIGLVQSKSVPELWIWIIIGAVSAPIYSAAMFVVFTRVKQLPTLEVWEPPADRVTILIRKLGSTRVAERWDAARQLGALGPKAAKAVPALTNLLADSDNLVREAAQAALTAIGERPTSPN